jgi:hypothetical protein
MDLYYSMGPAHTEGPTLSGVLECLHSDFGMNPMSCEFEEWAEDLGYDTDSRKAEKGVSVDS